MTWKSLLPSLVALGGAALTIFTPQLQHEISSHPSVSAGLLLAYSVLTHILPPPQAPPAQK